MKKWTPSWTGFVVGLCFAGWSLFQEPKPAFCVFLQTPLTWLFNYIDSLRIYPRESLAGLVFAIPLWFIYWACFGALVGFLPRLLICLFGAFRRHGDAQHESGKQNKREMAFCVGVGLIILVVIPACILHSYFPQHPNGTTFYQGP